MMQFNISSFDLFTSTCTWENLELNKLLHASACMHSLSLSLSLSLSHTHTHTHTHTYTHTHTHMQNKKTIYPFHSWLSLRRSLASHQTTSLETHSYIHCFNYLQRPRHQNNTSAEGQGMLRKQSMQWFENNPLSHTHTHAHVRAHTHTHWC